MSNTRRVEFVINPVGMGCEIRIDGEPVPNVRAVTLHSEVGKATTLTLELINLSVLVAGKVHRSRVKVVDVTPIDADVRRYGLMAIANAAGAAVQDAAESNTRDNTPPAPVVPDDPTDGEGPR